MNMPTYKIMIYSTRAINVESTNRIAATIVAIKNTFSAPRLVWNAELILSPPRPAPELPPDC